jgi:hypothetical protein
MDPVPTISKLPIYCLFTRALVQGYAVVREGAREATRSRVRLPKEAVHLCQLFLVVGYS